MKKNDSTPCECMYKINSTPCGGEQQYFTGKGLNSFEVSQVLLF